MENLAIKYSCPSYFSLGATLSTVFSWPVALQSIVETTPIWSVWAVTEFGNRISEAGCTCIQRSRGRVALVG